MLNGRYTFDTKLLQFQKQYQVSVYCVFTVGLGRVQTRPEIWPAVPVFLKTWTEPGLFLAEQLETPEIGFFET